MNDCLNISPFEQAYINIYEGKLKRLQKIVKFLIFNPLKIRKSSVQQV